MPHTGHKSESSIRQYTSKCPPKKRRQMSDCLATTLEPNQKKAKICTESTPPENQNADQNVNLTNNQNLAPTNTVENVQNEQNQLVPIDRPLDEY